MGIGGGRRIGRRRRDLRARLGLRARFKFGGCFNSGGCGNATATEPLADCFRKTDRYGARRRLGLVDNAFALALGLDVLPVDTKVLGKL